MFVKQLSIFVENKPGRVAAILSCLAKKNIDLSALSLADATDYGVLRLIVDKPDEAQEALREEGVVSKMSDVLVVAMKDTPGMLSEILEIMKGVCISVNYMYAFVSRRGDQALVVVKTSDLVATAAILRQNGILVLNAENLNEHICKN